MNAKRYDVIDLSGLRRDESIPVAVNNNGDVIGRTNRFRSGTKEYQSPKGFLWENGRVTNLKTIAPKSINDHGWIVGREVVAENATLSDRQRDLALPPEFPIVNYTALCDINNSNTIVGWLQLPLDAPYSDRVRNAAFLCEEAGFRYLEIEDGCVMSEAVKVNDAGCAVGHFKRPPVEGGLTHSAVAAIWDNAALCKIEPMPGFNETYALDVNDCGQVLCRAVVNRIMDVLDRNLKPKVLTAEELTRPCFRQCAFIYSNDKIKFLKSAHNPWWDVHIAHALNNHGQVVGTSGCGPTLSEIPLAFLYENAEFYDLNALIDSGIDWTLYSAVDINDHGQIVGTGEHQGRRTGFLLNPI